MSKKPNRANPNISKRRGDIAATPRMSALSNKTITFLIAAIAAIAGWIGSNYTSHLQAYNANITQGRELIRAKQEQWILGVVSISSIPIEQEYISDLRSALISTSSTVATFRTNDATVDKLAKAYQSALEDAAGIANVFDGSKESLGMLINSVQQAANVGGDFSKEVDALNSSFSRKLLASFSTS